MPKKRESIVPRKPDGKIDWKAYDKQLVQRSRERCDIQFIPAGDNILVRIIDKRGGSIKGGSHVRKRIRRQKRLESV